MTDEKRVESELFGDFLSETEELVETLIQDLLSLEDDPARADLIQQVFRSLHTIKGNAGFLGYAPMVELSHRAEDLMDLVRGGQLGVTGALTDALLLVADAFRNLMDRLKDPALPMPDTAPLLARLAVLGGGDEAAPAVDEVLALETPPEAAAPVAEDAPMPRAERDSHTVRVDVMRIDQIMNQVGELVLERNRMNQLVAEARTGRNLEKLIEPLADAAGRIHSITAELQMAILKVRMVPVELVFRKFPRVVRDLSARLGKEVQFSMHGGDTELDKQVAEAILDPLTHLVRNALDHGIESPQERLRAGKSHAGQLEMSAVHEGNHILVRVRDDGAGIDSEKVRRKAVARGLITEERSASMGRSETLGLLFAPGFSTADSVSDVSGRGVGLDVVKTRLRNYHGMIEIQSDPGAGTQVTLKLPLTLAIVPSLLVRTGNSHFALPLASVEEVVQFDDGVRCVVNGAPCLRWRDRVLPLVDLAERFKLAAAPPAGDPGKAIVLGIADTYMAVRVDSLIGQEEVVIKPLGKLLGRVPGIAGGTIMGDGRVALIVDLRTLLAPAHAAGTGYAEAA